MKINRKAFTLVEIMAASAIMTIIVLAVLNVTTNILKTWNSASGELKNKFDGSVICNILQEDFESAVVKKDGRAWFQIDYPESVGVLTGSNYLDNTPLKPPEIMFYSSTLVRPRYTRENLSSARASNDSYPPIPIPGNICAIKYQLAIKSPFMKSGSDPSVNEGQYNAFFGLYRAVIDSRSTVLEAMGDVVQGYEKDDSSDGFRYALSNNLWTKACTIIDEQGVEQPGQDLKGWTLDPENLLAMNVVDFKITLGVFYKNPSGGLNEPLYKVAYIPPGTPVTVGPRILANNAFGYSSGGGRYPVSPDLIENGFLGFADFSMTLISDAGAKEMRALMKSGNLTVEAFKRLVLMHGNTVTRRVQFMAEPLQ